VKKSAAAEAFIPFEPMGQDKTGPDDGPRLNVVPKTESEPSDSPALFTPLQKSPGSAEATVDGPPHSHAPTVSLTPTVSLQRDGDRVTHIRVECSCGQVIELACKY